MPVEDEKQQQREEEVGLRGDRDLRAVGRVDHVGDAEADLLAHGLARELDGAEEKLAP